MPTYQDTLVLHYSSAVALQRWSSAALWHYSAVMLANRGALTLGHCHTAVLVYHISVLSHWGARMPTRPGALLP